MFREKWKKPFMILGYSEHSLGFIAAVSIPLRGGVFNQPSQKEEYRPINQQKINTVLNLSTIHHNTPNHITPHYEIKRNNRKRLYINDFFSMTQYKTARHTTVQKISLIIWNKRTWSCCFLLRLEHTSSKSSMKPVFFDTKPLHLSFIGIAFYGLLNGRSRVRIASGVPGKLWNQVLF